MAGPRGWEIVEHTADVGIRGWGKDFPALVEALARGLFEVIAGPADPKRRLVRKLRVEGVEREDLLHDTLEALNSLHQVRGEIYARFEVEMVRTGLVIEAHGEPIDPDRHDLRTEVKAVTWHELRVTETELGWEGYVLLDI